MKRREAVAQLGTLGHGNHFLELMRSETTGRLWLVVHTGSRGIGQAITDEHIVRASERANQLAWLDADSKAGRAYLADAAWAVRYARANRHAIADAAVEAMRQPYREIRLDWDQAVETAHDFIRRETHHCQEVWVHRKGVQPLATGEFGILPSAMGQRTLLIYGLDTSASLGSVSHGCGRVMSRKEAIRSARRHQRRSVFQGLVTAESHCHPHNGEAPWAFRSLHDVTAAQRDLFRRADRLVPRLCYKSIR